ncbi:ParB N-terminal domain-containing protein [Streptomyces sp. MMBL 11-3]|uniref:ParB N-terminal domain-containing protein n=1 Tax=Streptomyces sp. MMBL 11-3 TaxID=3382639 RepID=UPI0039B5049B
MNLLIPGYSPRIGGEITSHVQALAETEGTLPPIIVHRPSMRVIDGMHRVRSAILRGQQTIRVRYFDGTEQDAFVLAVRLNVKHGLPLTLAERRRAAARIVVSHAQLSDRAIASLTGLSGKTVGEIRKRTAEGAHQPLARVGRDGRTRPLNTERGRRLAAEYLSANPGGSLREVSRVAGISPETVRDVRDKLSRGEDPIPVRQRFLPAAEEAGGSAAAPARTEKDGARRFGRPAAVHRVPADGRHALNVLRKDPSLRFTEAGRVLLRLMDPHILFADRREQLIKDLPEHTLGMLSEVARQYAASWSDIAGALEERARQTALNPQSAAEIRIS